MCREGICHKRLCHCEMNSIILPQLYMPNTFELHLTFNGDVHKLGMIVVYVQYLRVNEIKTCRGQLFLFF